MHSRPHRLICSCATARTVTALMVGLTLSLTTCVAFGQELQGSTASPAAASEPAIEASAAPALPTKLPWRGSSLALGTSFNAIDLDRSVDLTYNPYVAMNLDIAPRWYFSDVFYVFGRFSLVRELTESDVNTYAGEFEPSDTTFGGYASRFTTLPVLGIDVSAGLDVRLPSSKISRARTLQASLGESLRVSRGFDVLSGIEVGYGARFVYNAHAYTTAELAAPRIESCVGAACDPFINTGVRNTEYQVQHAIDFTFAFLDNLAFTSSASLSTSYLYGVSFAPQASFGVANDVDQRWVTAFLFALSYEPVQALSLTLGASTANSILGMDGQYEAPAFNRYTTIFFELGVDIGDLTLAFL